MVVVTAKPRMRLHGGTAQHGGLGVKTGQTQPVAAGLGHALAAAGAAGGAGCIGMGYLNSSNGTNGRRCAEHVRHESRASVCEKAQRSGDIAKAATVDG